MNFLDHTFFKWGTYSLSYSMILGAILIVVIIKLLLYVVKLILRKRISRYPHNKERLMSLYQLLKYFIYILGLLLVLEQLDIKLTLLLAGSAALLVGLGLGLQQTFNDFISGIIILAEGSLKKNDVVEVGGLIGKVHKINLRTSIIYTRDGINIIVPNHKFINENVINWSHNSRATRFRITVGVAYSSDEELVKEVLLDCLSREDAIIKDNPEAYAIYVRIVDFGNSSIDFEALFWSKEIFLIEQVKSNIRFSILKAFRDKGIVIPFPQRDIHIIPSHHE
jgi:small-conductance mechanosensitive channel